MKQDRPVKNEGLGWSLSTRFGLKKRGYVVHRDHAYPARFSALWRRDDGLEVEIDVTVDRDEGPLAQSVTVRGLDGGVASAMRGLPVPSLTAQAAAALAADRVDDGTFSIPGPGSEPKPIRMGHVVKPRAKPSDRDARLRRVAAEYKQAVRIGAPVAEYVARQMSISNQYASNQIGEAKRAELLPPSRGRGAKVSVEELEAWEKKQQRKGRR